MFEFEISDLLSIDETKSSKQSELETKPFLIFQGEQFEINEVFVRLKNMMIDYFNVRDLKEANLLEMRRMVVFTAVSDTTLYLRHYESEQTPAEAQVLASLSDEPKKKQNTLRLRNLGPSCTLTLKR